MFDFAWTEIALIGVVALVLIGPKDMPVAIKAVANVVKKARRMASEFQTHVDEMVRDTELAEVRNQINEIRNMDIRSEIERAVDDDGSLRRSFDDPFVTPPATPASPAQPEPEVEFAQADNIVAAADPSPAAPPTGTMAERAEAPAFIPPAIAHAPEPPAFIPPGAARPHSARSPRL